jgi:Tfp pilus assembly protein PilE
MTDAHDTFRRTQVESQLLQLTEKREGLVLVCLLFIGLSRLIARMLRRKSVSPLTTVGVLFVLIATTLLLVSRLSGSIEVGAVAQAVTASLLVSLIFLSVWELYPLLIPPAARIAIATIENQEGIESMYGWFGRTLNIRSQLSLTLFLPSLTLVVLAFLDWNRPNLSIQPTSYISLALIFFAGSNILYLGGVVPYYLKTLSEYRLRLFSFDPAFDPNIRLLSQKANFTLSLGSGIVFLFMVTSYFSFLLIYSTDVVLAVMSFWYVLGVLAAISMFSFSNYFLSRMTHAAKDQLLVELQAKIDSLYEQLTYETSVDKLKLIEETLLFYRSIRDTNSSTFNWQAIRVLLSALIVQTAPFLLGAINWSGLFAFLPASLVKP